MPQDEVKSNARHRQSAILGEWFFRLRKAKQGGCLGKIDRLKRLPTAVVSGKFFPRASKRLPRSLVVALKSTLFTSKSKNCPCTTAVAKPVWAWASHWRQPTPNMLTRHDFRQAGGKHPGQYRTRQHERRLGKKFYSRRQIGSGFSTSATLPLKKTLAAGTTGKPAANANELAGCDVVFTSLPLPTHVE